MAQTKKQTDGQWGEAIAESFLKTHSYEIITKNFAVREGEIDIIAWHTKPHFGKTLCFIEVKTRSGEAGSAERSVGSQKLNHMKHAAMAYCLRHHIDVASTPIQFEQVSIYGFQRGLHDIRHYELPQ